MVVGDGISGYIWATGRREDETSFTPFAFSRSRFLCAGTWLRERSWEALRRAWDTYFCCYTLLVLSFLLCVHDGGDREGFLVIQVWDMKFMLFIKRIMCIAARDSCDLIGITLILCHDIAASAGVTLPKMRKATCPTTTSFLDTGIEKNLIR
jgi:hypothetical protein